MGGRAETSRRPGAPVAGISGAIAGGKTTVAQMLAEMLDGEVISADDIAHDLLAGDPEIKQQICSRWGTAPLDEHGEVSRAKLADIVFDSPDDLAALNRIIHPRILKRIREEIGARRKEQPAWVVLDAALLFETGLDEACDVRIFVDASFDLRVERAKRTRGWDARELSRRQQAQMPPDRKRELSDYTVNNNGDKHETKRQIERIVRLIERRRRKPNG